MRHRHSALLGVLVLAGIVTAVPGQAATPPLSHPVEVAHFDVNALQQPENITLEPNGAADVTFNGARQVARIGRDGSVTILRTLPAATTGPSGATGIVRADDGTLFVNYNAGAQSAIWRLGRHGTAAPFTPLPAAKFLNGLALDRFADTLYATDSATGTVYQVQLRTGRAVVWAQGGPLLPTAAVGFGSNGIKVHDGAVWVSNTAQGTLLRIPIGRHGTAGPISTVARGLAGIDDFTFTGFGDTVLAALNSQSEVSLVHPGGSSHIVLTAADGLSNPTSLAVRGSTVYVASAAYATRVDPNLLLARLG